MEQNRCGALFLSREGGIYSCDLPPDHCEDYHEEESSYRGYSYCMRWQGDYRKEERSFDLNETQRMAFFMFCNSRHTRNMPWSANFENDGRDITRFFIPGQAQADYRDKLEQFMEKHGVKWNDEITEPGQPGGERSDQASVPENKGNTR